MAFDYLPIMAQHAAPKPPRLLATPTRPSWCPITKPLERCRIALLASAALRLAHQQPFVPRQDLSYRLVSSDPSAGEIVIDHHSGIGRVPRTDPEIVFPRTALASLAARGVIGSLSPMHVSFMGSSRQHREIETELAPAIVSELAKVEVDLALLVPY